MSTRMEVDLDELRDELRAIRDEEGVDHVNCRKIARRVGCTPKQAGAALQRLYEFGELSKVAYSRNTTWRIEV